ncbi:MAG: RHS repeat-associated core domain-containing protein [Pseudomonadales bacterium]|nr:RHS repeat-associated core domain-containing protein [Pseudomonadales bacterium]MBH2077672.1 RHS repeat-associated core domain-containing protein [Pseudomonadales bacterium]
MTLPRNTLLCQYRYDPLDRITDFTRPDMPQRQRFYCKSRLTTEIQGAQGCSIIQHDDQLLAQQRGDGVAIDTTLLVTDQQRSVLHTLKTTNTTQPIAYSPYGHHPIENGLINLLGFNGEQQDPVTRCYVLGNGYRAFSPILMRFNSPDSLSPFGKGGLNSYTYCLGDPVNLTDQSGHMVLSKVAHLSNLFEPRYANGPGKLFRTSTTHTFSESIKLSKSVTPHVTSLEDMPYDVFEKILNRLEHKSINNLAQTSKTINTHTNTFTSNKTSNILKSAIETPRWASTGAVKPPITRVIAENFATYGGRDGLGTYGLNKFIPGEKSHKELTAFFRSEDTFKRQSIRTAGANNYPEHYNSNFIIRHNL